MRSPPYLALSFLLPWGLSADLDGIMRRDLGLEPPVPAVAYGLRGVNGHATIAIALDYASGGICKRGGEAGKL